MNLKVLVSSSRKNPTLEMVTETLRKQIVIGKTGVYTSKDFPMDISQKTAQERIDSENIPEMDWFIMLAPLDFVGKWTCSELNAACESYLKTGKPTITIFHKTGEKQDCLKADTDMDVSDVINDMSAKLGSGKTESMEYEQYCYEYSNDEELPDVVNQALENLVTHKRFLQNRIYSLARKGSEIKPEDLYFDKARAAAENGFIPERYFRRKSVDDKLSGNIKKEKFNIILGPPGSGKTRAVYELIRSSLADKNIIVIDNSNREKVLELLNFMNKHEGYDLGPIYFICDQINDVLTAEQFRQIGNIINAETEDKLIFIATSTEPAYEEFLQSLKGAKINIDFSPIRIKKISGDGQKEDIRAKMSEWFRVPNVTHETIGEYIPQFTDYSENIIKSIIDRVEGETAHYTRSFIRAVQIHSAFRKTNPKPLFIPLMILRNYFQTDSEFERKSKDCILFLAQQNVLTLDVDPAEKEDKFPGLQNVTFKLDSKKKIKYDDEWFESIIPTHITYTVNELVFYALNKRDEECRRLADSESKKTVVTYSWENKNDLEDAIDRFYSTFPTAKSLSRMIPRLPRPANGRNCIKAGLVYIRELLDQYLSENQDGNSDYDIRLAYNNLIGRASNLDEVKSLLDEMHNHGIGYDDATIGEIYRFAIMRRVPDAVAFANNLQNENNIEDSLYTHVRKLEYFTKSADDALKYFDDNGIAGKLTKDEKNDYKDSYHNSRRILTIVCTHVRNPEECRSAVQLFRKTGMKLSHDDLYGLIFGQGKQKEYISEIYGILTENDKLLFEDGVAEMILPVLISNSPDFETAYGFYTKWVEQNGKDSEKLFSMCINIAGPHNFQSVMKHVDEISKRNNRELNPIVYNNIIKSAPTLDDGLMVASKIEISDSYSLCNLLKKIQADKKRTRTEKFFLAYETVNRPEMKPIRSGIHVVSLLFAMAECMKHEDYIMDKIVGDNQEIKEAAGSSKEILSTKIRKDYRNVEEAFDIVESYYEQSRESADLYSTLLGKIYHCTEGDVREKYIKRWEEMVQANEYVVKDEDFFSAVWRFTKPDEIISDGKITDSFANEFRETDVKKVKTITNILNSMRYSGYSFADLFTLYDFYINWYKEKMYEGLKPDHRLFEALRVAAKNIGTGEKGEDMAKVHEEMEKYGVRVKNGADEKIVLKNEVSALIGTAVKKQETAEGVLSVLESEYIPEYGTPTVSVLNSSLHYITTLKVSKDERYEECIEFIQKHNMEDKLTANSFKSLVILAQNNAEWRKEIVNLIKTKFISKGYVSESLFRLIADNFSYESDVREDFNKLKTKIYTDIGIEL